MDKFTKLTGVAAPMPLINVDTDMIIPKQFLKTIAAHRASARTSSTRCATTPTGNEIPDFVLNKPAYRKAQILVAGENFGCGSSREHAPWALLDFGIRCVIAPSFADIFYNNCFKNGILPIALPQEDVDKLMDDAERGANAVVTVDLENQVITGPDGGSHRLRGGRLPQALPAERPRRHRPHHGEGRRHRRLRGGDACAPALAGRLINPDEPLGRCGVVRPGSHFGEAPVGPRAIRSAGAPARRPRGSGSTVGL